MKATSDISRLCTRSLLHLLGISLVAGKCAGVAFGVDFSYVPQLDDERLQKRLSEAREFRGVHLNWLPAANSGLAGSFRNSFESVGPPGVRHTLGGSEFPWATPGGRRRNGLTRKFVWPANVQPKLFTAHYRPLPNHITNYSRPGWVWPVGTTLIEVHYHEKGHPFEVRVLEKVKNGRTFDDSMEPHIFRPFQSRDELPAGVVAIATRTMTINSNHPRKPFRAKGEVTAYRSPGVDWNREVRKAPWPDDLGHEWFYEGYDDSFLAPRGYLGWIVGNGETCGHCHSTAGRPVVEFDGARDWYGMHRGSDFIFSLLPKQYGGR